MGQPVHGHCWATGGMTRPDAYPSSVEEVLDARMTFNPAALRAVRAFARAKPWRGSLDDQHLKFRTLHAALCKAYGLDPHPRLIFANDHATCSGSSCFIPSASAIVLRGRLSVVTYLHEFAHARGMNERQACRFSLNLFRRVFPQCWSRVQFDGHMVRVGRKP